MAAQLGNYVLETATAPGTGSFTLNGPEFNRRAFSTAFPGGGNVLYFADDGSQAEWGIGTLTIGTPSTLARSTVIGNTAGTKVALNFPGSVEVYNEIPAEYVPVLEQDGSLTLAGSLTVKGKTLVQNVDNFTSQEAIPAAQADGRYLQRGSSVNTSVDFSPLWAGINRTSGEIWMSYADDSGNTQWAFAQPAGDYATNPALNTEITNRTNADANLQSQINNRVQKTGDTMSWLEVDGGNVILKNEPGTATAGQFNYSQSVQCETDGRAAAAFFVQEQVGGTIAAVIRVGWLGDGDWLAYYWFDRSGKLGSSAGEFALTSDLPFVDQNLRVQVFNATASNGAFVTLPQAFSTLVGVTAQQHSSGGEGIRPIRIETNVFQGNGFNVSIWSEGGGIQYTFVAYGYF